MNSKSKEFFVKYFELLLTNPKSFLSVKIILIICFLTCLILRLLTIRIGLNPYIWCDEGIYLNEIKRMAYSSSNITKLFLTGGVNTYPVVFIIKFLTNLNQLNLIHIQLIARFLFPVLLSSITVFLIFKLVVILFESKKIAILSSILYTLSSYQLTQSHYYYPDYYVCFFAVLSSLSIANYYKKQNKTSGFLCIIALAVAVSVKYTMLIFVILAIVTKIGILVKSNKIYNLLEKILLNAILFLSFFFLLNFSMIKEPIQAIYGFANNIAIYGSASYRNQQTLFYLISLLIYPLGLMGVPFILHGAYLTFRKKFRTFIFLFLPLLIWLLLFGHSRIYLIRNINLVTPIIFIFAAVSVSKTLNFKRISPIIVLVALLTTQLGYVMAQETKIDSRIQAQKLIKKIIPLNSQVGYNPACGYLILDPNKFNAISDSYMNRNLDYYVFDTYWPPVAYSDANSTFPWYFAFNPTKSIFYLEKIGANKTNSSKTFTFLKGKINREYKLIEVKGAGPNVWILKRHSSIN